MTPWGAQGAWAKGIGGTRAGVFETNFREETVTDLFGEQCVLCGGASALVKAGFEVLVEAGYSPEMAYFECLHELKLIVDLMNESGIAGMRFWISETAEYGDVTVGPKIINESVKNRMRRQLKTIESGRFAKEWVGEFQGGCKNFNKIRKAEEKHGIEKVGAKLRGMMSWLGKKAKSSEGSPSAPGAVSEGAADSARIHMYSANMFLAMTISSSVMSFLSADSLLSCASKSFAGSANLSCR